MPRDPLSNKNDDCTPSTLNVLKCTTSEKSKTLILKKNEYNTQPNTYEQKTLNLT